MSHASPTAPPWSARPPTPPDLAVASWGDLDRLPAALDDLDERARLVVRRARGEVCDTRGLEPSPLCVLRPLVPALQAVEQALGDLGRAWGLELERLRSGVLVARDELGDADDGAARAAHGVGTGAV